MKEIKNKELQPLVFSLGFTSVIFQIVILKEFLSVVQGNELTIGIIIATWMLITGLGAKAGSKFKRLVNKTLVITILQIFFSIIPLITIILFRCLWYEVFSTGEMIGILPITITSIAVLLPFTFLSGLFFTLLSSIEEKKEIVACNYFIETSGTVAGGVLISLILVQFFNSIIILLSVAILNLLLLIYVSAKNKKNFAVIISCVLLSSAINIYWLDYDYITKSKLFPGQKLIEHKDTPYGNVAVTKTSKQFNVFESGVLSASNDNIIQNEETVHFAMVQHPNPKSVLMIGGWLFGIMQEILKYKPLVIDIIEQNEYLLRIDSLYGKMKIQNSSKVSKNVNVIIDDPKLYLAESSKKYDVIILNLPPPSTAQLNRFYTIEFIKILKKHLLANGVISMKMPATENYMSESSAKVQSIIYKTLKSVFKNVIIIPSSSNHYIASNNKLIYDIPSQIESRKIATKFVNKFYLNQFSLLQRADFITHALDTNASVNTNFKPIAFYSQIDYFLSYFDINKYWILACFAIVFGLILFRLKKLDFVMFTVGYSLSMSEIIVIFSFQILFGNIYQYIGIIFALFMLGLSLGSRFVVGTSNNENDKLRKRTIAMLLLLSASLVLLSFIFTGINFQELNQYLTYIIFFIIIFIISFLAGGLFANLSLRYNAENATTAGNLYSADLYGSALGAVLVSCFLLPAIGLEMTSLTGAGLLLFGLMIYLLKSNK